MPTDAAHRSAAQVHRSESKPRGPAFGLPFATDPNDLAVYRAIWRPQGQWFRDPERELRHAVLELAMKDFHDDTVGEGVAVRRAEALAWFMGSWGDEPYSFAAICEALDLHPGRLRAGILAGGGRGYRQHSVVQPDRRMVGSRNRRRAARAQAVGEARRARREKG